jgi:type II secretory pathway pseudopilin PulG
LAKYSFSHNSESGFSLVETMISTMILATALVALAQLFAVSGKSNSGAKNSTFAMVLAQQKMEQLRGLTWGYDNIGLPISDTQTNTTVSPETPTGGRGLTPSQGNTLKTSTDGYVDFLDAHGNLLGGGTQPPVGTTYIRRWLIEPLPTNPNNTLIIQVLVTRRMNRGAADAPDYVERLPEEGRLISVKTRKAQ